MRCLYCNNHHYSASCEKVTNPRDRRSILIEANCCFLKCLSPGHQIKECTYPRNCRICGGVSHHQSVCFGYRHIQQTQNETAPINDGESGALGSTVNATSSTKAKGRILFDNGSQQSYVTDNLKSKLGLKPTSSGTLHLNTIGENAYRKQKCQVVTLPLRNNKNEYLEISALNFLVISSPLSMSVDINKYPHLQDLELADHSKSQDSIDIFIESDHYWDIITGKSICGEFGPTVIHSKVWMASLWTDQHVQLSE